MREFTSQELNCAIETTKQKLEKLDLCSMAWQKLYGERNLNLEGLRKYNTQLLDDYINQGLLKTEESASDKTDTRQMYGKLRRLEKELKILDEIKGKLKEIVVYSRPQESEESRILSEPIELRLFEKLYNFVAQERDDLRDKIKNNLKANNAKLKNDTDLTLRDLKRRISSYEQSLLLKQIEASRYIRDFGVNNPTLDKEISETQQSLDYYKSQLYNLKIK
jgi:hypothetical protein